MNFEDKLNKALFEGWDELGIADPGVPAKFTYTDEEISQKAPKKYGFAYYSEEKKYNAMRTHPLYIQMVRMSLSNLVDQIDRIKNKRPQADVDIKSLPLDLGALSDTAVEIADDIGWGDPRDIIIAAQRHPLVIQLLNVRDSLKG